LVSKSLLTLLGTADEVLEEIDRHRLVVRQIRHDVGAEENEDLPLGLGLGGELRGQDHLLGVAGVHLSHFGVFLRAELKMINPQQ
jgi:hypothetical protein